MTFKRAMSGGATASMTLALAAALCARAGARAEAPVDCVTRGGDYAVGTNCREVDVDGHPRRFVVYVPATRPASGQRVPVVFMFHGSSGSGEQFLRISGWREQADRTEVVAVFPTGQEYRMLDHGRRSTKWNDGGLRTEIDLEERPSGYPEHAPFPADDVGFVDTMLADLSSHLPVDRHRLYASGFSNGANFAARLAVERSTVFAAVGFFAGGLQIERTAARPIPMSMALGTRDDRVLAQTELAELPLDPPAMLAEPLIRATIGRHLNALGLDPGVYESRERSRYTELRWPASVSGQDGATLRFAMLAGMGHHYPNGNASSAGFVAAPNFWEFFAEHRLP
jgi:polyhydroxybutyrate depolymerase